MPKFHSLAKAAILFASLAALSVTALAADKAVADIKIPPGCPQPVAIVTNGSADGTIQILYTYLGPTFTAGQFACFDVSMAIADDTGGSDPTYPANIAIGQIGGENVILTPGTVTLKAYGIGTPVDNSPVHYTVSINPSVPNDPTLNEDGDEIVGNLRITTVDKKLRTVPNILVKILLVHPSGNCLKTYHQIMDKDNFAAVPSMKVYVQKNGQNAGLVNNSDPPGIFDSVLVANTCSEKQSFDLLYEPSDYFEVQTAAPGNSIHVYSGTGELPFSYFAKLNNGTGKGTDYCIGNLEVPANSTFLATAALKIRDKTSNPVLWGNKLPNAGNCSIWSATCIFEFNASLWTAGSACQGSLIASPPVSVNPLPLTLDFTTP